ncbi:MAG: hypothetical protein JO210_05645 [Acidobacteriaceae bacterium]|nr:hypothetical protein [Acidobacteriaceae bacterium]
MANLFFPQLSSGAIAQYPIRKKAIGRTIRNLLPDGSLVLYPDTDAKRFVWQLGYSALSSEDLKALSGHFTACQGRLQAFTFIDPTDNMLSNSANLLGASWSFPSTVSLTGNIADPSGSQGAFSATNNGQESQEISQILAVPAGYQYCFSIYVLSGESATLNLIRRGPVSQQTRVLPVGPQWTRVVSSGQLSDTGAPLTVAISLEAGQQISLYGPQLEPQIAPSRYRPTLQVGGVYANAYWAIDELPISAEAPNLFSTVFSVEAAI